MIPALKIDREKSAFFLTLVLAVLFIVFGALKGTDITYGVATSSTVTTTVTATVNPVISISASASVDLGAVTAGTPVSNTGDVTVTSNSEEGWKLYNYADNYMTKTTTPYQSITNTPAGTPDAPAPWTAGTTKGLGFSLSGPTNEAKWHDGAGNFNYSSFTTTSAGAQLVNNYTTWSNQPENLTVLYALDVDSGQLSGTYRTVISWFAVTNV